jgi:hypothetical protein
MAGNPEYPQLQRILSMELAGLEPATSWVRSKDAILGEGA